jgi:hypothetical protein
MKQIVGFLGGSQAYKDAMREKEVVEFVRRKWGTLSAMLNAETTSKNVRFWSDALRAAKSGLPAYSTLTGKLSEMA